MPLPPLRVAIDRYLEAARLTNPAVTCVGIAINSSYLSDDEWRRYQVALVEELALPVCDPMRTGVDAITRHLLAHFA